MQIERDMWNIMMDLKKLIEDGQSDWIQINKDGTIQIILPGYELRLLINEKWYIEATDGG